MRVHGPERSGGQGLDRHQEESGNRAIAALLTDDVVGPQVDLVLTWRAGSDGGAGGADDRADGAYEVWSARGMVRFRRLVDDGGALRFEVLEVLGENPIADQDPLALATIDAERSHLDVRGTFWLSGNETALDLRGTTFIETLEGPSLQRATDVSIAGPLVAVDPGTGEATVNATCGRDGQVPYHYSVDEAGRLVIDVPLEGIEGVLRLFFE